MGRGGAGFVDHTPAHGSLNFPKMQNLIVTDAMMPLLDGYGLIRVVRTETAFKRIPILMLT
jgi:CheY-like chemotaxis protein